MEGYSNFVYFGGGGGYEIKNQIVGYKTIQGEPILGEVVHEESTGEGVANYMTIPKDKSNTLLACVNEMVHIYQIDIYTGALTLLQKIQGDFSESQPCLNHTALSFNN